jgi:hypothetical protein
MKNSFTSEYRSATSRSISGISLTQGSQSGEKKDRMQNDFPTVERENTKGSPWISRVMKKRAGSPTDDDMSELQPEEASISAPEKRIDSTVERAAELAPNVLPSVNRSNDRRYPTMSQ